jgi:hypothetical protein
MELQEVVLQLPFTTIRHIFLLKELDNRSESFFVDDLDWGAGMSYKKAIYRVMKDYKSLTRWCEDLEYVSVVAYFKDWLICAGKHCTAMAGLTIHKSYTKDWMGTITNCDLLYCDECAPNYTHNKCRGCSDLFPWADLTLQLGPGFCENDHPEQYKYYYCAVCVADIKDRMTDRSASLRFKSTPVETDKATSLKEYNRAYYLKNKDIKTLSNHRETVGKDKKTRQEYNSTYYEKNKELRALDYEKTKETRKATRDLNKDEINRIRRERRALKKIAEAEGK